MSGRIAAAPGEAVKEMATDSLSCSESCAWITRAKDSTTKERHNVHTMGYSCPLTDDRSSCGEPREKNKGRPAYSKGCT